MPYRGMLGLLLPLSVAACVTPSGLPCVTLAYTETRWENRSWGLHNVNRFESSGIQAYRGDGARAIQGEFRQWTHYIFPARTSKAGWLDLPDRTVSISHDRKTFLSQPRPNRTRVAQVMRSLGADCAAPGYSVKKGARIAGFETYELNYTGLTDTVRRIYRAPALGCLNLKEVTWEYNRFGIPTGFREWEVQSVELGAPDPRHFEIPAGYRIPASRID